MSRYEPRAYVIEPHWHVRFGRATETLVYATCLEEIAAWLKRVAVTDPVLFGGVSPVEFTATQCPKNDCKPRPRAVGTLEEFLRHPMHGWWRRLGLDDLV